MDVLRSKEEAGGALHFFLALDEKLDNGLKLKKFDRAESKIERGGEALPSPGFDGRRQG
jgi:hypothetical protein